MTALLWTKAREIAKQLRDKRGPTASQSLLARERGQGALSHDWSDAQDREPALFSGYHTFLWSKRRVSYNSDFRERQAASTKAKAALLERFRAAPGPNDPERRGRDEARVRVIEARHARAAAREAARIEREKALAEESAREAERRATEERAAAESAEKAARLKAEEEARVAVEQKAARDARYAARKAAKKQRRQEQKERPR